MIRLKGSFTTLTLDPQRFTKTLDKTMEVQMRGAAKAWLLATVVKIPTWTGMSRGSFKPLAKFLRTSFVIRQYEFGRPGMNPDTGAASSSYEFGKKGTTYFFKFTEGVQHLVINDEHNVKPPIHLIDPGPYHAFAAGESAFQDYVNGYMKDAFPRVEDILNTAKKVIIR